MSNFRVGNHFSLVWLLIILFFVAMVLVSLFGGQLPVDNVSSSEKTAAQRSNVLVGNSSSKKSALSKRTVSRSSTYDPGRRRSSFSDFRGFRAGK